MNGSHDHEGLKDCAKELMRLDPLANLVLRDKDGEAIGERGAIAQFSITLQALINIHGRNIITTLSSNALLKEYLPSQYPVQEGLS